MMQSYFYVSGTFKVESKINSPKNGYASDKAYNPLMLFQVFISHIPFSYTKHIESTVFMHICRNLYGETLMHSTKVILKNIQITE